MRLRAAMLVISLLAFGVNVPASDLVSQGVAALEANEFDTAAELFEQAHRASRNDASIMHRLAVTELARGNAAQALEWIERAVGADGDHAEYRYFLGLAEATNIGARNALGKMRAATRMRGAWERAVALDPNHLQARMSLVAFYAQAPAIVGGGREKAQAQVTAIAQRDAVMGHRARARLMTMDEDYTGAGAALAEAAALVTDQPERRAEIHAERGFLCQQSEDWECAHAAFVAATEDNPGHVMAWYQIGRTAVRSGERLDAGIAALQRYLEHRPVGNQPSHAWAHTRLGQLLERQGRVEEARAQFRRAVALDEEHVEANSALTRLGR